jgi:hypothetical protein
MAHSPNMPCSSCGKLMWAGKGSKPAGQGMCQPCRRVNPEHRAALAASRVAAERAKYEARRRTLTRDCTQCGVTFQASHSRVRSCSLTCGQLLRNAEGRGFNLYATDAEREAARLDVWQRKNRKRRALKKSARSERYSLAEIAERDGYRCGICMDPVNMLLRRPDVWCPTIDHIHPISAGGDDLKGNVQLAHFTCNSRKGAKVA